MGNPARHPCARCVAPLLKACQPSSVSIALLQGPSSASLHEIHVKPTGGHPARLSRVRAWAAHSFCCSVWSCPALCLLDC